MSRTVAPRRLDPRERLGLAALVVALDVLVAGPLLWRGAPLLLDLSSYPVGPHPAFAPTSSYGFAPGLTSRAPLYAVLHWFLHATGLAPLELVAVLVVAPLACVAFARLAPGRAVAIGAATTLYTVNPFVYDRMANGQWFVVLGYALLPAVLAVVVRPAGSLALTGAAGGLLVALAVSSSVHYAFIVAVLLALVAATHLARSRREVARACGAVALGALVLDLYWLVPALRAGAGRAAGVSAVDLGVFATRGDRLIGLGGNVAGLFGFWRPGAPTIKGALAGWPLVLVALLVVVGAGLWSMHRRGGPRARALAASCVALIAVGWLLAQGTRGPAGVAYGWAFAHVPGFRVMREPEKFGSLVALGYAVGFGAGVEALAASVRRHGARVACAAALTMLPLLYAGTELWGFSAAGAPTSVPSDWARADAAMVPGATALALPWSAYVAAPWTHGRVVANPAASYLARPVVSGDDLEAGPIVTESTNPQSAFLSFAVARGPQLHWFGRVLAPLGIREVVLEKVAGWRSYAWLGAQRDLRRVFEGPTVVVFESTEAVPRAYAPGSRLTVRDWGGVLGLAERLSLTDVLVQVRHARPGPLEVPRGVRAAAHGVIAAGAGSPVDQPLDLSSAPSTVVLTRPAEAGWTLGGYRTASQFGVSVAFERAAASGAGPGAVARYGPWQLVRACDVAGFALLAVCLCVLVVAIARRRARGHRGERTAEADDLVTPGDPSPERELVTVG